MSVVFIRSFNNRKKMIKALAFQTILGGLLIGIIGCDNGRVSIQGQVTLEGKPLESGSISFVPLDGKGNSAGAKINDGAYRAADVLPGKKRVQITAVKKTGKRLPAGPPMPPNTMVDEIIPIYPPPQEVEIVAGEENNFSFELP